MLYKELPPHFELIISIFVFNTCIIFAKDLYADPLLFNIEFF